MAGVKGRSGGRREGAGRKASGAKKVQVTITITQQEREDLDYLKSEEFDTNKALGREIHRLAKVHARAKL